MKCLDKLLDVSIINEYALLRFEQGQMTLMLMQEGVLRIKVSFNDHFMPESSYILTQTAWDDAFDEQLGAERKRVTALPLTLNKHAKGYQLTSTLLTVVIQVEPFALVVYDGQGRLLHQDLAGKSFTQDHLGRVAHYQVTSRQQDHYYGFGEQSGGLDKIGKRMRFCSKDNIGYDSEHSSCLYKHIPFFIKLTHAERLAVGYFYHNTYESYFDAANEMSGYWASYIGAQYAHFGAEAGEIDLFIIAGPSMAEVVERYTDLTGKSALMPRYALGYLGSTMYYTELAQDCDDEVLRFIRKTKQHDLPIDGFFLSSGYTVEQGKRYVFTWNNERFKEPAAFLNAMQSGGVYTSANIKPGVLVTHPKFEAWKALGIFIKNKHNDQPYMDRWWGGSGVFFDFTNPKAREVWQDEIQASLLDYGMPALWNDNNEYDSLSDVQARCAYDGQADGSIAQLKPIMATLMAKASYQALLQAKPTLRPYVTTRAGSAGIQRYAQTWSGDNLTQWKSLSYNIATLLNLGLSGLAHVGADVGGFFGGAPSKEMFLRWVQSGIFYPRFSIHSANTDNTVTEPWMYRELLPYIRQAFALRYAMIPYWYSLNYQAYQTGQPLLRPMLYEFQREHQFDNVHEQFMLGKALLVAPVLREHQREVEVILPDADAWYDLSSGERFAGGQRLNLPVTWASIPYFLRAGEFFCRTHDKMLNAQSSWQTLEIVHAPEREGYFSVYEDDGISNAYQDKQYRLTTIRTVLSEGQVHYNFSMEGSYASTVEQLQMVIFAPHKAPLTITLADKEIPQTLEVEQLNTKQSLWYYDHDIKAIRLQFALPAVDTWQVNINFATFDLIGN